MRALDFKRVRYEDIDLYLGAGWKPARAHGGAVGVDPYAGGTQSAVLMVRPALGPAPTNTPRQRRRA